MSTRLTQERWQRLMQALGMQTASETYRALLDAYAEAHRHYHTARHIDACLRHLDVSKALAASWADIELALWFHDAVYDPYQSGNEERSADWACEFLQGQAADAARTERVRSLILATKHDALAPDPDAQLLVDIDLAILGASEADYDLFEINVREEYQWVPAPLFREKRAEILQSFLDRPQVYNTEFFRERYEIQARSNLRRAISALTSA
jgi:predicted metal-dependent HD superfamily phosphohydrolase